MSSTAAPPLAPPGRGPAPDISIAVEPSRAYGRCS
jgi:hypothetical protein